MRFLAHAAELLAQRKDEFVDSIVTDTGFTVGDAAKETARAAGLCVNAAFRKAGQVCTSVQRLHVEQSVVDDMSTLLAKALEGRVVGDPRAPGAFVGPVISAAAADRIETRIRDAVAAGAERDRQVLAPTVLADVPAGVAVMTEKIFGPVVVLRPFTSLDDAITEANDTPYGLAAGVFTASLDRALTAARRLRVGTVHINETSSSRVDLMPFGGVKASGVGAEGPRYAVEQMTEEKLITIGPSWRVGAHAHSTLPEMPELPDSKDTIRQLGE